MSEQPAPEEIHHVTQSIFSIARHFGGCKAFGASYTYDQSQDVQGGTGLSTKENCRKEKEVDGIKAGTSRIVWERIMKVEATNLDPTKCKGIGDNMATSAREWLAARTIITKALNEFYPTKSYGERDRNEQVAAAILARLASAKPPLLVTSMMEDSK